MDAVRTLAGLLSGFALLRLVEHFFPPEGGAPERPTSGFRIWIVYMAIQLALTSLILLAVDSSPIPQVEPQSLLGMPLWLTIVLVAIAAAVVQDFFFYWGHRIQHRWLWRWHAPHHAIRNMSAVNSWHHWSEVAMHAALVSLPMSLLSPYFGPRPFLIGVLLSWQPIYLHSATRLQLGPRLSKLIIDGRFHRIHHSLEKRHYDRNFGAVTPLWDWLFGTAYFPRRDEWPDVGLDNVPDPQTVGEWSSLPWRAGRRSTADAQAESMTAAGS